MMALTYAFGGDSGDTYEGMMRKRRIAEAMLASRQGTPRNIGEGLDSIGKAIAGSLIARRADKEERRGQERAAEFARSIFGSQPSPAPASPARPIETAPLAPPGELPPGLMDSVFAQESGGDPNAVSPKGATGVGQVMRDTARDPGYGVPNIFDLAQSMGVAVPDTSEETLTALLTNPEVNKAFSTNYMEAMFKARGGDTDLALASYNAGPGAVDRHGGIPPYAETQAYVPAVKARMAGQPQAAPQTVPQALTAPQPPAQGPQGVDPRILQALGDPYTPPGMRAVLNALLEQQMSANAPMSPYEQARIEQGNRAYGLDQREFTAGRTDAGRDYGLARDRLELDRSNSELTPLLRNYNAYAEGERAAGREPLGQLEYETALKGGGTSLRVNPETGEFEFSQGGPGGVTPRSSGTPGLTALDKTYAPDFIAWATGGAADTAKSLDQLENSLVLLESGQNITGPLIGQLPDAVMAFINPDVITAREGVEEVVQRNLKLILGGQFTEREGEKLVKRAFNPALDEAENAKRLRRLLAAMRLAAEAKTSAAAYFREHGTLNGWDGKIATMADFEAAVSGSDEDDEWRLLPQ